MGYRVLTTQLSSGVESSGKVSYEGELETII